MNNTETSTIEKVFEVCREIAKEFLVGTSVCLNTIFFLKANNHNNIVIFIFWLIITSIMFDKIVLKYKPNYTKGYKRKRIISLMLRTFFIITTLLASGTITSF